MKRFEERQHYPRQHAFPLFSVQYKPTLDTSAGTNSDTSHPAGIQYHFIHRQ